MVKTTIREEDEGKFPRSEMTRTGNMVRDIFTQTPVFPLFVAPHTVCGRRDPSERFGRTERGSILGSHHVGSINPISGVTNHVSICESRSRVDQKDPNNRSLHKVGKPRWTLRILLSKTRHRVTKTCRTRTEVDDK